jgi:ubiquitin-activating enzyme E1
METMGKLIQLKVLIVGMRGLGAEIAKNIILSGPQSVTIYDPVITKINDLSSNFYLTEEDVGKNLRDEASIKKLSELNPYVKVSTLKLEQTQNLLDFASVFCEKVLQFNVVVFTELQPVNLLIQINNTCRQNNIKFIYACNLGLAGYIFTDFGPEHIIFDQSEGVPSSFKILSITKDKKGLVKIDNEKGENNFNIGDGGFITFSDIEGMTELNGKEFPVEYEDFQSFRILQDTSNFKDYIKGGKATKVLKNTVKQYFDFNSRSNIITDMNHPFLVLDSEKIGRSELLYMALIGIHDYYISHNCTLPELNNLSQAKEIEKNVKQFYDSVKKNKIVWFQGIQEYDEKVVINVIRWCRAEICPITAFFGGIVSHEIIKATGKYEPIDQWLIMDFFEIVENIKEDANRDIKGSRYDDQIAIFGNEIQKKIEQSKIFMIGAGATGCEFLKNFAMMGFCTNDKDSKFIVTDNDSIEVSNLSRQFLFRQKDVGSSKAVTASNSVKLMNPKFNVVGLQKKFVKKLKIISMKISGIN